MCQHTTVFVTKIMEAFHQRTVVSWHDGRCWQPTASENRLRPARARLSAVPSWRCCGWTSRLHLKSMCGSDAMATGSGVVPRSASLSAEPPHTCRRHVCCKDLRARSESWTYRHTGLLLINPSASLCFGFVLVWVFGYLRHPEFDVVLVSQGRSMKLQ